MAKHRTARGAKAYMGIRGKHNQVPYKKLRTSLRRVGRAAKALTAPFGPVTVARAWRSLRGFKITGR